MLVSEKPHQKETRTTTAAAAAELGHFCVVRLVIRVCPAGNTVEKRNQNARTSPSFSSSWVNNAVGDLPAAVYWGHSSAGSWSLG